jgi:Right handed beta helix region
MKRTVLTRVIILALLMLMVAGARLAILSSANFFPDPGPDLPQIYIRSNGNVEPASAPIDRSGNNYKLKGNIVMQTIIIQRDNIVLDGSGYLIEGNKSWMGLAPSLGDAGNNGIIIAGGNNINITNFNIEQFTAGVRISGSSHINIVDNNLNEEAAVFDTPIGIVIETSSQVLIENNNFTKINGPAIACNGTNMTIRGNSLIDIADGIYGSIALEGSSNTITDNKIETASPSIRLGLADSNIIARNNITGGLSLVSSSNNIIFGNNLTDIRLIFSSNNTIFSNYMTNNPGRDTIELDQGTTNNTFYANTFPINFSVRFNDAGTTFWDNGTIGNYWSDYKGTDSNGDGVGDSPFTITGVKWDNDVGGDVSFSVGQDDFPLMVPYDIENDAAVLPQAAPFLTVTVAIVSLVGVTIAGVGLLVYFKNHKPNTGS